MLNYIRFVAAIAFVTLIFPAQHDVVAQTDFRLPEDPAAWLNSPPITSQRLEGKAALLYFFEEG